MTRELAVLRALLRLARRRTPASLEQILLRVGHDARDVRRALVTLSRQGLVHKTPNGPRLTLAGFAVAVAAAAIPRERAAPRPGRVVPLTRKRSAA